MSNEEREKDKKRSLEGEDPYIDGKRKKVLDFLLGIILMIGETFSICFLVFVLQHTDLKPDGSILIFIIILFNWIFTIIDIILIIRFLKKNRKYLVIGIIIGMIGYSIMLDSIGFVIADIVFLISLFSFGVLLITEYQKLKTKN